MWTATAAPVALGGLILFVWPVFPAPPPLEEVCYSGETEIKFGRGPDCTQRGLCEASTGSEGGQMMAGSDASGKFFLDAGGAWGLEIAKASISAAVAQEQFKGGVFEMADDFTPSLEMAQALGASTPAILSKGVYTVEETELHYVIRFTQSR